MKFKPEQTASSSEDTDGRWSSGWSIFYKAHGETPANSQLLTENASVEPCCTDEMSSFAVPGQMQEESTLVYLGTTPVLPRIQARISNIMPTVFILFKWCWAFAMLHLKAMLDNKLPLKNITNWILLDDKVKISI